VTSTRDRTFQAATERVVRNGEVELAVFEYGDPAAETVVLVHGWPDTHHLWEEVVPLLADRFHVVSYDQRGHGRSTNPKGTKPFRLDQLADDFLAVARAVSPERPVHVLAHDWGSVQVWEAVCEPDAELYVASFTSVSGPNLDHLAMWARSRLSRPTPRNLAGPLRQLGASGYTVLFQLPVVGRLPFALVSERSWRRFLKVVEGTPGRQVHLGETFRQDAISGLRIYRANIRPAFARPRERHTAVPVQLLVNLSDVAVRPSTFADEARWTKRLWRRDVPAGHWSPFSHPHVLARAVRELIDHLAGAEPSRELRRSAVGLAERGRAVRRFEDKLVVVTGGGSGIGRETALAFAREGAEIVVCDRNPSSAKETSALVAELGGSAHAYDVDVASEEQVAAFAAQVAERHGEPDVLVNNAGVGQAGAFLDTPSDEFQRVLDINLNGVVHGCRAFAPMMVDRGLGGQIVNLASLAAFTPQRGMGAYSTSKAAVLMFSECLRAELAQHGVGVTAICPGIVHTNIVATTRFSGVSPEAEAEKQERFDRLYARRNYGPEKVAGQIVKAVLKNKAVLPVTPESYQGYYASRLAPGLVRRFAKLDVL
jgi:NAD(P)-dependent dehydrogenase (short-subunit alcohol dehydrogenase family)/pimeloyl-ACP methyl ester carboxylesterase